MSRLYVATKNAGKLRELRAMFARAGVDVATDDAYADVAEGETSYAANAALKAHALRAELRKRGIDSAVLGDDSGLEVRALGDRPGVLSARYGGPDATWPERRRRLLDELKRGGSADRSARFVCALHHVDAAGRELAIFETFDGAIAASERGDDGFSYDPIFALPGCGRTFAELPPAEKNRISHRARAVDALLAALAARGDGPEGLRRSGNESTPGM